jgi:hypothetical protein
LILEEKILVDLVGIEPTTSSMPWKRAPSCATGPHLLSAATLLFSPIVTLASNRARANWLIFFLRHVHMMERTMPASAAAASSAFQVILLSEHHATEFVVIEVFTLF